MSDNRKPEHACDEKTRLVPTAEEVAESRRIVEEVRKERASREEPPRDKAAKSKAYAAAPGERDRPAWRA